MTQVTNAKQWRSALVELPSGFIAELRPVGFELMLKSGRMPDFMTPMILGAFKGEAVEPPSLDELSQAVDYIKFLDACCTLAFVSPRVRVIAADDASALADDEITSDSIDLEDKMFVFQLLGKPRRWLDNFSPEQKSDVGRVADEPVVPAETEPIPELEEAAAG